MISPFNRVEGDLDVSLEFEGNKIKDAKFHSALFRGFEIILKDKDPLDSLVLTPRICGICGASHLYASVLALENVFEAQPTFNAIKLRNVLSMSEICQNDIRHTYLMFLIDLTHKKYKDYDLYPEIIRRWSPLLGSSYKEAINWSKKYTEIYAIFGGQWPHGSAMVPGGVTTDPSFSDINKALGLLKNITENYLERIILGGNLQQFLEIKSVKEFEQWVSDYPNSEISFLYRVGTDLGLDKIGYGSGVLMSYGHLPIDESGNRYFKPGLYFVNEKTFSKFDQNNIIEFVTHSHYVYTKGDDVGLHPFEGETIPKIDEDNERKYTFTKCVRYNHHGKFIAPEVGALAMLAVNKNPLILDFLEKKGPSVLLRVLSRFIRLAIFHDLIKEELKQIDVNKPTYRKCDIRDGKGYGLVEAPRGSLGHWIIVKDGKIYNYQIVTPTQINMSPEDPQGNKSHLAKALIGLEVSDPKDPIEAYHVIRAQDSCMVCNVH